MERGSLICALACVRRPTSLVSRRRRRTQEKQAQRDTIDERAEKAERQAQIQHTTSLLSGGKSSKNYVRVGERSQRKGTVLGFLFQLSLVMIAAGGIAYAIDPTILSPEWSSKAHDLYKTHVEPHVQTVAEAIKS